MRSTPPGSEPALLPVGPQSIPQKPEPTPTLLAPAGPKREEKTMQRDSEPVTGVDPDLKGLPCPEHTSPPRPPLALRIGVTGHRPEASGLPPDKKKRSDPDVDSIRTVGADILRTILYA